MSKNRKIFRKKSTSATKAKNQASGTMTFGSDLDSNKTLELGDSLPALWNIHPDGRIWVQDKTWFDSKIGKTTVRFKRNRPPLSGYIPCRVENCLFPNGDRGLAIAGAAHNDPSNIVWRRPTSNRGHWWPGSIKFSVEEAVFSDLDTLLPIEKIDETENKAWLAGALMGEDMPENKIFWTEFYNACTKSEMLKTKVRNDTYAWEFWGLFINHDFIHKPSGSEVYYTSDRRMGEVISRLRGCGENYLDFYFGHTDGIGPEPTDREKNELLELFEELGFVSNTVLK